MTEQPQRRLGTGVRIALIGAGVAAGALGATAIGAAAATSDSTSGATIRQTGAPAPGRPAPGGPALGGAHPERSDEQAVTGEKASTLKAAARKAVPGATVVRVESDAGDAVYEVHMRRSDGSPVTVKFNKDLAVTKVEDGMGLGDPGPEGGPHH